MPINRYSSAEIPRKKERTFIAKPIETLVTFIFKYRPLGMVKSLPFPKFYLWLDQKCFARMISSHEISSPLNLKCILLILCPYPKRLQGRENILNSKRRPNPDQKVTIKTVWEKRILWYAFKIQVIIYWEFIVNFARLSLRKSERGNSWRTNVREKGWRRKRSPALHLARSLI